MHSDEIEPATPQAPGTTPAALDPAALKGAHARTGRLLQNAGLPFEDEEFDEAPATQDDAGSAAAE